MAPTEVLDLDDLFSDRVVKIDGKHYALIQQSQFSPLDIRRLQRFGARLVELLNSTGEVTEAEERELDELPGKICQLVLDAPPDIQAKLSSRQRMSVVTAFMQGVQVAPVNATPIPAPSLTGATSAPASLASTEVSR